MVYHEKAYVRHYKRNDNKNNRVIKSVEVRGLKNTTKFKDKEPVIILTEKDFKEIADELNQMQEKNNELTKELNNIDNNKNHETTQLYNKLFDLMEMVNNRNELIINANDNLNYMLDAIIKELQKEYINLIEANNKEIKARLNTFIKSIVDNAKTNQKQQSKLIAGEINNIESEIKEANQQLNNMSILQFIRKRKDININLDLKELKDVSEDSINFNDLDVNLAISNIFSNPDFNKLDHVAIKENSKKEFNFKDLYIKLE